MNYARNMESSIRWYRCHSLWLELFVLVNLAFLGPDIYLAHSMNSFRHSAEYVPLVFSLVAPAVLLAAILLWRLRGATVAWRWLGLLVGWAAVFVGVAGLLYHLESHFFDQATIKNLVYTAPFAAPLSYTGIGLLLLMNRMVDPKSKDWPRWVILLALGGFIGNLVLSLADHAQNGFFHVTEWIPVASSAFAVGFLCVLLVAKVSRGFVWICAVVLLIQAVVGLLGFYYHTAANLNGPAPDLWSNTVFGAPPMAPLLFPNLVLLALIGLWVLRPHLAAGAAPHAISSAPDLSVF